MPPLPIPPTFGSKSFSCPHCGAHADQTWLSGAAKEIKRDESPYLTTKESAVSFAASGKPKNLEYEKYEELKKHFDRSSAGEVFVSDFAHQYVGNIANINLSNCYTCKKAAIWNRDKLIFPAQLFEIEPNVDLSLDIQNDFNEARSILDLSPRGAAALLRLAIQKLCKELGKPGKDVNADIASLVADGLNIKIQKALDIVRVVGNEAVHPGQMDLKDDRVTASKLFSLVNKIAYDMITHPKELDALYNELPQSKLEGILKRDAK